MKSKTAIIIPAFQEERSIGQVVTGVKNALAKTKMQADIIVVNDGSSDNTTTIAKQKGAIVIDQIINTGQGGAASTGLSYARQNQYQNVAMMDADGQHDPADVIKGLQEIENSDYDLLIGSRLVNPKGMSLLKRVGNNGLSFVTFLLFGVKVTDSQSGMRILSEKAIATLSWKTDGYEFCSEMLWRAKQKSLKIGEFPIQAIYTDYSKSKARGASQSNWNGINLVKTLLRHRLSEIFGE